MSGSELPASIRRIRAACGRSLAGVALFSAVINVMMLTGALYMLQVYDRVLTSRSWETLLYLTVMALGAFVVMGALEALRGRIVSRVSAYLDESLAPEALERVIEASILGRAYGAEALRDIAQLRQTLAGPAIFALFDIPWTPIYLAVITFMHPALGAIAGGGALVLVGLAATGDLLSRRGLREGSKLQIHTLRRAESIARNAEVIDAMGMFPALCRRWLVDVRAALSASEPASDRVGGISASTKAIRQILQIMILGAGAWLVLRQEATGGVMIAASILMGRALAPVDQVIGTWKVLLAARESYSRLRHFLAIPSARHESMPLPEPAGRLAAERITYVPPGGEAPTLNGISFAVGPGETLAVIGPSASGKSTLARLMVGVLKPRFGHMRLDGADVHAWNREQFGTFVGYLPQDVELFDGTVAENIARFSDGAPHDVVSAAQLAGCHEMILRLPNGYATEIGEGGAKLSAGQRQRVGLARALFGNPRMVVLDEPNAHLDTDGEQALAAAIQTLSKRGTTVVVVTHRPALLSSADKVLVLRDGNALLFGSRDEVLAKLNAQAKPSLRGNEASEPPAGKATVQVARFRRRAVSDNAVS